MHGGYTHILLAENTVKNQLRDTAVTQDPLSVLAFGRIYDDEINATPGVNRPNGRKDYQLLYVEQGTLQITIDNKQRNLNQSFTKGYTAASRLLIGCLFIFPAIMPPSY